MSVADQSAGAGDLVTFTAQATGVGPAAFAWYRDGSALPGQTQPTLSFTVAEVDHASTYSVTVTNAFDRTATAAARLLAPPTVTITGGPHRVEQGESLQLTATASDPDGGPVTVAWDLDGDGVHETAPTAPGGTATFDASGRRPGDHVVGVQATDDEQDTATATTTVTVTTPAQPTPTTTPTPTPDPTPTTTPDPTPTAAPAPAPDPGPQPGTPPAPQPQPEPLPAEQQPHQQPAEESPPTTATTSTVADAEDPSQAAIDISRLRFGGGVGQFAQAGNLVPYVVLARADVFADALGGSVLTGSAPLLYTSGDQLEGPTAVEIDRLLPGGGTVHLLGGPAALSDDVAIALADAGHTPHRLVGPTRVETAIAIADAVTEVTGAAPTGVALARADGTAGDPTAAWADAITAGGWAAETTNPILLTPTDRLHPATSGGHLVANGTAEDAWAYALSAAGLAADTDHPILLVDRLRLPTETDNASCATGTRADLGIIGPLRLVGQTVRDALTAPC